MNEKPYRIVQKKFRCNHYKVYIYTNNRVLVISLFRDALLDGKLICDYYDNPGNKYLLVYTV